MSKAKAMINRTRRDLIKKAGYVAPTILTFSFVPSFASAGSGDDGGGGKDKDKGKGKGKGN